MLVKPVRCKAQPLAWFDFLETYGVRFERLCKTPYSRYQVLLRGKNVLNEDTFYPIGVCFSQGCIWVFVPSKHPSNPERWFFGQTRLDCLAGYFNLEKQDP